jgi:hypothetical protein
MDARLSADALQERMGAEGVETHEGKLSASPFKSAPLLEGRDVEFE